MHKVPELPAGVMVFIFCEDKIHLIHRDNKAGISLPNTYSPVTGGVKINETYSQAIERELRDETGLVFQDIVSIGESEKRNCFFFLRITPEVKETIILGEGQAFGFYGIDEIPTTIAGAFKKYFEAYPEVFRRMFEDINFVPTTEDLWPKELK
ncbi:MAG: NUDIX domain-containing protein [Candidatus Paceibacterota bacterium]